MQCPALRSNEQQMDQLQIILKCQADAVEIRVGRVGENSPCGLVDITTSALGSRVVSTWLLRLNGVYPLFKMF